MGRRAEIFSEGKQCAVGGALAAAPLWAEQAQVSKIQMARGQIASSHAYN